MNNKKSRTFPTGKSCFYFLFAFPRGGRCHGEAVTDEGSTDFEKSLPAVTDEGARPYAAFFSLVRHRSATVVAATTVSATAPTMLPMMRLNTTKIIRDTTSAAFSFR